MTILSELTSEPWAMHPRRLEALAIQMRDVVLPDKPDDVEAAVPQYRVLGDGIAEIPIRGILMSNVPWYYGWLGIDASSYAGIAAMVDAAAADPAIKTLILRIDSPGGTVSGLDDARASIERASKSKDVAAVIENLGASAAYWLGVEAKSVMANELAEVGSIGVFMAVYDQSGAAEKHGVKVHVISSGELKGAGVPGSKITDPQLSAWQSNVDALAGKFFARVKARRPSAEQVEFGTGRTWIAEAAQALGLIDSVSSFGAVVASKQTQRRLRMEDQEKAVAEATAQAEARHAAYLSEMTEAFAADPAFGLDCIAKRMSVADAKGAYCAVLAQRNTELKAEAEAAYSKGYEAGKADAMKDREESGGAPPMEREEGAQAGTADFLADARALAKEKKLSLRDAISRLSAEDPARHKAWLASQQPIKRD